MYFLNVMWYNASWYAGELMLSTTITWVKTCFCTVDVIARIAADIINLILHSVFDSWKCRESWQPPWRMRLSEVALLTALTALWVGIVTIGVTAHMLGTSSTVTIWYSYRKWQRMILWWHISLAYSFVEGFSEQVRYVLSRINSQIGHTRVKWVDSCLLSM